METLEAIHARRSVRSFTDEPISDESLQIIIEAAVAAPSHGNAQMWTFISVRDQKRITAMRTLSPGIIGNPTAVIVMCLDQRRSTTEQEGSVDIMPFFDIGAAFQNISLAAHDIGLGSCAIGSFHSQALRSFFSLPEEVAPVLLVVLGEPRRIPQSPPKRPVEEIHFQEKYEEPNG
jgi:albonoursin synthase